MSRSHVTAFDVFNKLFIARNPLLDVGKRNTTWKNLRAGLDKSYPPVSQLQNIANLSNAFSQKHYDKYKKNLNN